MPDDKGNTAVPAHGDRDRVAMLSLKADGTPDQHNPEIVGKKEFAEDATREQFRQQAVSAVDQAKRPELFGTGSAAEELSQDPKIEELQDAHKAAEKAAEKAADSTVKALFVDDDEAATGTAATPAKATPAKPAR
jgi:hypothetical protein